MSIRFKRKKQTSMSAFLSLVLQSALHQAINAVSALESVNVLNQDFR